MAVNKATRNNLDSSVAALEVLLPIAEAAGDVVFNRGLALIKQGAVSALQRHGEQIVAHVQGQSLYQVVVQLNEPDSPEQINQVHRWQCNCPAADYQP